MMPSPISAWVAERFPDGGFFVEAGAHDGVGDSTTYHLEKLGEKWQGICVEPSSAFAALRRARRCSVDDRALWSATGADVMFREVGRGDVELSGLVDGFKADGWDRESRPHRDRRCLTVSLTDLLIQHGAPPKIEFLSLDTEGSELEILTAHEFSRFRFLVVFVEHNGVEEQRRGLLDLLVSRGYERIGEARTDDLFVWRLDDRSDVEVPG